jgi:hypothetical protein
VDRVVDSRLSALALAGTTHRATATHAIASGPRASSESGDFSRLKPGMNGLLRRCD